MPKVDDMAFQKWMIWPSDRESGRFNMASNSFQKWMIWPSKSRRFKMASNAFQKCKRIPEFALLKVLVDTTKHMPLERFSATTIEATS